MFIEKLTESDLNNYAEGWFKQNLSEFECDSVEMARDVDYVGKLNEIKLKFSFKRFKYSFSLILNVSKIFLYK